jgi:hypothetical protein
VPTFKTTTELREVHTCFDNMLRFTSVGRKSNKTRTNPNSAINKEINNTRAAKRSVTLDR